MLLLLAQGPYRRPARYSTTIRQSKAGLEPWIGKPSACCYPRCSNHCPGIAVRRPMSCRKHSRSITGGFGHAAAAKTQPSESASKHTHPHTHTHTHTHTRAGRSAAFASFTRSCVNASETESIGAPRPMTPSAPTPCRISNAHQAATAVT